MDVWIDLETTGLSPEDDQILEMGIVLVNEQFVNVAERNWIFPLTFVGQERIMNIEFVLDMHTKNGLLKEIEEKYHSPAQSWGTYKNFCEITQHEAQRWMLEYGIEPVNAPMSGASVHFDRNFLREYMPRLEQFFHYRNFDVSTLKAGVKAWNPEYYKRHEHIFDAQDVHRAIPDCYQEIEEAKLVACLMGWEDVRLDP